MGKEYEEIKAEILDIETELEGALAEVFDL